MLQEPTNIVLGRTCPHCGEDTGMGHNTAVQFTYCWWECFHCGYMDGNIPPKDVLQQHKEMFIIGE